MHVTKILCESYVSLVEVRNYFKWAMAPFWFSYDQITKAIMTT